MMCLLNVYLVCNLATECKKDGCEKRSAYTLMNLRQTPPNHARNAHPAIKEKGPIERHCHPRACTWTPAQVPPASLLNVLQYRTLGRLPNVVLAEI